MLFSIENMTIFIKATLLLLIFSSKKILSIENDGGKVKEFKKCIEMYCLPVEYNNLYGPFEESGISQVGMDFDISHISEIDDIRFTVTLVMHLGMTWTEPQLIGPSIVNSSSPTVSIDNRFVKILWFPDLYIFFLKEIQVPKFYNDFAGEVL